MVKAHSNILASDILNLPPFIDENEAVRFEFLLLSTSMMFFSVSTGFKGTLNEDIMGSFLPNLTEYASKTFNDLFRTEDELYEFITNRMTVFLEELHEHSFNSSYGFPKTAFAIYIKPLSTNLKDYYIDGNENKRISFIIKLLLKSNNPNYWISLYS